MRTVEEARALAGAGVVTDADLRGSLGAAWWAQGQRNDGMSRLRAGARQKLRSGRTAELTPEERGYLLAAVDAECPESRSRGVEAA